MSTTHADPSTRAATSPGARRAFLAVVGLASLVVLFQAVWAGLFVHEGEDYQEKWVTVHARGAELAILLAVVATVLAVVKLRARKDLLLGAAGFAVLLILESYLGGLIGAHSRLTVVHFPLGMALMALSVWLSLRANRPGAGSDGPGAATR